MLPYEKIDSYLDELCNQIRWKKARPCIKDEMRAHIADQRDAFIAQGLNENDAIDRAISETGDATTIGLQLDQVHRPTPQWGMLASAAALLILGLFIRMGVIENGQHFSLLFPEIGICLVGLAAMAAAYFFDFTMIGKHAKLFCWGIVGACALLALASRGYGDYNYWLITLGQCSILLLPLALAASIFDRRGKGYKGMALSGLVLLLSVVVALLDRSIAGFAIVSVSGLALMSVAVHKKWFGIKRTQGYLAASALAAIMGLLFVSLWGHPFGGSIGVEHSGQMQIAGMIKESLGGAQWIGRGAIPEQSRFLDISTPGMINHLLLTDYLLTGLIVNYGWITAVALVAALVLFVAASLYSCAKQKSSLGMFVSLAVVMTFTLQIMCYTAYNLGVPFPNTLSLPLLSDGGTAIVINMALVGTMLSVFRTGSIARDELLRKASQGVAS